MKTLETDPIALASLVVFGILFAPRARYVGCTSEIATQSSAQDDISCATAMVPSNRRSNCYDFKTQPRHKRALTSFCNIT